MAKKSFAGIGVCKKDSNSKCYKGTVHKSESRVYVARSDAKKADLWGKHTHIRIHIDTYIYILYLYIYMCV